MWVATKLIPKLEQEHHLHVCIHHRDWLVRDIVDNVVESVESSRKTVLIVSNAFAASEWCQFELIMAQSRVFTEGRDNLILVLLEEIDERLVTPRLRFQLKTQTYIEWTNNEVGQTLFWKKLAGSIKGVRSNVDDVNIRVSITSNEGIQMDTR